MPVNSCTATTICAICSYHLRCMRKNTKPLMAAVRHITHIFRCMKPFPRTITTIISSLSRVVLYHRSPCVLSSLLSLSIVSSRLLSFYFYLSWFSSFLSLLALVPHHFSLWCLSDLASLIATCRCTVSTLLPHATVGNSTCTDIHADTTFTSTCSVCCNL